MNNPVESIIKIKFLNNAFCWMKREELIMESKKTLNVGIGLVFGVAIGAGVGLIFNNIAIGAGIGAGLGLIIGAIIDSYKNKTL